jgi:predicted phage terminase large subunit-like protein
VPAWGRYVIGIDLAYSVESAADYFAMVALKIWEGKAYVLNVWREKRDLDAACHRINLARAMYPNAAIFSYVSGPEKGAIQYLADRGIPVQSMNARYDKGTRAAHTIDAWNLGNIMTPAQAPWLNGFNSRVRLFTGNPKAFDDDEVDALVSACDGGYFSSVASVPRAFGTPRIGRY